MTTPYASNVDQPCRVCGAITRGRIGLMPVCSACGPVLQAARDERIESMSATLRRLAMAAQAANEEGAAA